MALSETNIPMKATKIAATARPTAAVVVAQNVAKELSDDDSGVEMVQESRRSSSSSSSSSSLSSCSSMMTRKYLLQQRRKTTHPKKRAYSELRRSLCSDSSISDHERPGSRDSGVRLEEAATPDGCLDLSVKEPIANSRVSDSPVASTIYSSKSPLTNVTNGSPAKRVRLDGDNQLVRQRRIEANARERTRVHTIGAAFESLRNAIPAYSHGQKLSKLAILRVASSYILALSSLLEDKQEGFGDAVQACSAAIHLDGKVRRR